MMLDSAIASNRGLESPSGRSTVACALRFPRVLRKRFGHLTWQLFRLLYPVSDLGRGAPNVAGEIRRTRKSDRDTAQQYCCPHPWISFSTIYSVGAASRPRDSRGGGDAFRR